MTFSEIVRSMSEEQQRHIFPVLAAESYEERKALIDDLSREEAAILFCLLKAEEQRRMAVGAAREARATFPEDFGGKSDQEIINEIAAVARRAGVTV